MPIGTPGFTSPQNQAEDLYLNLAYRGKGRYTCPHGIDCTKGLWFCADLGSQG